MDLAAEEWVKFALVEAERKKCISKVLSIESEKAVPRGENYSSEMFRLKVKVFNGFREIEERALVCKSLPKNTYRRWCMKITGFFTKEAKVYSEVLPQVEKILASCNIKKFWPDFYAVKNQSEAYIMQDIGAIGFKSVDRKVGLDFEYSTLVLDVLAKLHAASCVLLERGDIALMDYKGYYFANYKEMTDIAYKINMESLADVLEQKWQGEWVDYAVRIRNFCENYFEKINKEFKVDAESRFKVFCHGDPWVSNTLFKHDKNEKPIDVMLLDYQVCFIGTPAFDLEYFMTMSLKTSDIHRRGELLETYQKMLADYLHLFGAMSEAPTVSELQEWLDGVKTFAFMVALILKPLILMPSEEVPDIDKLSSEMGENKEMKPMYDFSFEGEDYVNSIKRALIKAKENGII